MAPELDRRRVDAYNAMKEMGIEKKLVKPVVDSLLKLYTQEEWKILIEPENYSYLVEAIFEYQMKSEEERIKKGRESKSVEESHEPPLKKLRTDQEVVGSCLGETSLIRHNIGEHDIQNDNSEHQGNLVRDRLEHCHKRSREKQPVSECQSPRTSFRDSGKELANQPQICSDDNVTQSGSGSSHPQLKGKEPMSPKPSSFIRKTVAKKSSVVYFREPKVEPGIILMPKEGELSPHTNVNLIVPKKEPLIEDIPENELPIATICPPEPALTCTDDTLSLKDSLVPDENSKGLDSLVSRCPNNNAEPVTEGGCSLENQNGLESLASKNVHLATVSISSSDKGKDHEHAAGTTLELANLQDASVYEIASSPLGEVKMSLSYKYDLERPYFQSPSIDTLLKMVEDKYLKSYKIIAPNFSLKSLMNDVCSSFVDLTTCSIKDKQENCAQDKNENYKQDNQDICSHHSLEIIQQDGEEKCPHLTTNLDLLVKSHICNGGLGGPPVPMALSDYDHEVNCTIKPLQTVLELSSRTEQNSHDSSKSFGLVQVPYDYERPIHDVSDIARGEESVKISVVNEVSSETYPPRFHYIPRNLVYQDAYLTFSLARVGDEDCCSNCFGDCLSSSIPCACARETGGEFAYTLEGLIKERFLDECISMNRDPRQHRQVYCEVCPLIKPKKEDLPGPCKGHLVRRFIKECWSKCGCSKKCGNRVVQRGIACKLQVFLTAEGKGWGLRTLEDLPKGAFICEYVGEVLTNNELHERNVQRTGEKKHTYPVLLDADWGSERVLKDEEALCLDATAYGNVARFINHRCYDSNMVEVPVEVETPDHHYYHLAFFTTRKINALEELTWDYGIDFQDYEHPVKAFRCFCGSQYCRDSQRSKRSKTRRILE